MNSPRAEGTPRLVLDLLDTKIGEQHVIFLSSAYDDLLKDFQSKGCPIYFVGADPGGFARIAYLKNGIYDICKDKQFDVAICWNAGWSQWIHRGTRKAGIPKLLSHAGNPPFGGFVKKYVYTLLTYWSHIILKGTIVVPSQYILRQFKRIPFITGNGLVVIPNCVRVDRFTQPKQSANPGKVIMVATLEDHKDHVTLLEAWNIVESRKQDAWLSIVGSGSLTEQLIKKKDELKLQRVTFLGSRKDVPELLWASDVFAFSTLAGEGFGTVLLEALAAGLKVVSTDVTACRETLVEGKYGVLVPMASPELFASAIIDALDRTITDAERNAQVAYSKNFSPVVMMENYLKA